MNLLINIKMTRADRGEEVLEVQFNLLTLFGILLFSKLTDDKPGARL